METAGCFRDTLAAITWDRITTFLPNLYQEMFPPQVNPPVEQSQRPEPIDEKPLKSPESPKVVSAPAPLPNAETVQQTNANITASVPDTSSQRGFAISPPIGNATFIEMEEGLRGPYSALPGVASFHNYQPTPSYPGTIEPFVTMPATSVPNIMLRDQNYVPNAQLSAYPWPAPSDQKNL